MFYDFTLLELDNTEHILNNNGRKIVFAWLFSVNFVRIIYTQALNFP